MFSLIRFVRADPRRPVRLQHIGPLRFTTDYIGVVPTELADPNRRDEADTAIEELARLYPDRPVLLFGWEPSLQVRARLVRRNWALGRRLVVDPPPGLDILPLTDDPPEFS